MGDYLCIWRSSEHHSKIAERFCAVLCENSKNLIFLRFLAQTYFFPVKLQFLIISRLIQQNGRLGRNCKPDRSTTVKLRSILVRYCVKTQRNPFFYVSFSANVFFFQKLPFFLMVNLVQLNGRLCYVDERHRSATVKLPNDFLQ